MFDSGIQTGDGTTFSQTFDEPGTYLYHCIPHRSLGQKGAIVVEGGSGDGSNDDGTGNGGGGTATVEMITDSGNYYYDPIGLHVEAGTTVTFENVEGAHNVVSYEGRIPEGAEQFSTTIGETAELTFETPGTYDFYCQPHKTLGMVGRIVVGEPGGPAEGSMPPDGEVPDSQTIVDQGSVSYSDFTG
jgi:pseudoazurin